jgi:4-hydroxybenzoate polyprenyltransferase
VSENQPAPASQPADALRGSWTSRAPGWARPYLQLARYDRPVGFWLLGLPCLIGLALARTHTGFQPGDTTLAALFMIGAIAMRGAGCTYNDILDRDIDARVARTALRPIPAGLVSLRSAWIWLGLQLLVGLAVLAMLPSFAQLVALAALPLVILYPLMKRITWWPQAWLGLTFNWGVLVAAAASEGAIGPAAALLYLGLALWTLGYDTIYAIQDREDDALIGVRSTARRFGKRVRTAVWMIYAGSAGLVGAAGWIAAREAGVLAIALFAGHLALQATRLDPGNGALALRLFRANRDAGLLLLGGWGFIAAFL